MGARFDSQDSQHVRGPRRSSGAVEQGHDVDAEAHSPGISIELLGNSGSPREAAHRSRSAAYTHVSPLGQSIIGVLGGP